MKKRSKLVNISLKTDVNKLNEYIDQQNKLCNDNPLIKMGKDKLEQNFNFGFYIYDYIIVLNTYILEKYNVANAVRYLDTMDGLSFAFKKIYNDNYFMKIKKYRSFYKSLQSFELVKDKIVALVDDYYTNLVNSKYYANEFLDKLEIKIKKYYSIDYKDISIIRKEFKQHIRFSIKYKESFIFEDNLIFIEYPYWKNEYKFTEKFITQEILFNLTSGTTRTRFLDKNKKLSYKDSMILLNDKLYDIDYKNFVEYFPKKAYDIYQARNILNEFSQN